MLVAHQQIIEREELLVLKILCRVVAGLILGGRFRRKDEAILHMSLQRDVQLIIRALRNSAERQPVADLHEIIALCGDGVFQEIIQPGRAAALARLRRIGITNALRQQPAVAIKNL